MRLAGGIIELTGGKEMGEKFEIVGPYIRRKKGKSKAKPKGHMSPIEELVQAEKEGIIKGRPRKIS
jgi:hypothetical protein